MKTTVAAVLLMVALFAGLLYAQTPHTSPTVGKFQIFSGEYEHLARNTSIKQSSIFKINTGTGETWQFVSMVDEDGKYKEFWAEVK